MTIETKYNIGDKVHWGYNYIKILTIQGIRITIRDEKTIMEYLLEDGWAKEEHLFLPKKNC